MVLLERNVSGVTVEPRDEVLRCPARERATRFRYQTSPVVLS
jgi:hypothetical protein